MTKKRTYKLTCKAGCEHIVLYDSNNPVRFTTNIDGEIYTITQPRLRYDDSELTALVPIETKELNHLGYLEEINGPH